MEWEMVCKSRNFTTHLSSSPSLQIEEHLHHHHRTRNSLSTHFQIITPRQGSHSFVAMNSGKEIMNCPWIEVWGLPAACLLYSVFLNNKTGYIRFYIIVSVFPRTIILIYLHTSPDFRSGYVIHWLFADCLCNMQYMQLSVSLFSVYINFHFSIFVME